MTESHRPVCSIAILSSQWFDVPSLLIARAVSGEGSRHTHFAVFFWFSAFCTVFCVICEIPTKFGWVSAKFATKIVKIWCFVLKNCEKNAKFVTKICWIFQVGAVQRNANLVELEKCWKMRLLSLLFLSIHRILLDLQTMSRLGWGGRDRSVTDISQSLLAGGETALGTPELLRYDERFTDK